MPKRMQRTDFSQCEESKRRKATADEQIDLNLSTSSVEEDLVSGVIDKDTVSLYYLQLKISQHSIIVLDKAANNFFLQDFNLKSNKLWLLIKEQKMKGQEEFMTSVKKIREQSASACQVIQIGAYRRHGMLADQQLLRLKEPESRNGATSTFF